MSLKLYNTLSREKEEFTPLSGNTVKIYNCGPTVYHYAHIGNLRAFLFADILRRTLEKEGYSVKQIMNITDVGHLVSDNDDGEDKMEKGARREGKTANEISEFYTQAFFEDLEKLNIKKAEAYPRATENIPEQIDLIQTLEKKGYTYQTTDGVYFDTSKYPEYPELAKLNLEGQESTTRVTKNTEKKHPSDFALWKFSQRSEKRQQEWESPWGVGYPGWHLECSAMAMKFLGETLDIHTGGIDHIPVHHTNERAQSVCATKKPFARFWMHSGFVNVENGKMAKSEENFLRLQTLIDREINPLAYRYWLLGAHYRTTMEFNWEALEGAERALSRLYEFFTDLPEEAAPMDEEYQNRFHKALSDDLGTPEAVAILWELVKDENITQATKRALLLSFDEVLGLDLTNAEKYIPKNIPFSELPENIQALIQEREEARKDKKWKDADQLRAELQAQGYEIKDGEKDPLIKKQ